MYLINILRLCEEINEKLKKGTMNAAPTHWLTQKTTTKKKRETRGEGKKLEIK